MRVAWLHFDYNFYEKKYSITILLYYANFINTVYCSICNKQIYCWISIIIYNSVIISYTISDKDKIRC